MNKRAAIIIAKNNQRAEFVSTLDVLIRAGLTIDIFGEIQILPGEGENKTIKGIKINEFLSYLKDYEYDAIIFPGGRRGVEEIKDTFINKSTDEGQQVIRLFNEGKLIAAICAAPSILGELGILENKNFTCYPGFEKDHYKGNYLGEEVVIDGNLITGRSMYYSADFGLEIVKYLLGKDKKLEIERQIKGIH